MCGRPGVAGRVVTSARDLIGIIDWRLDECKRLGVKIRFNHYVEPGELDRSDNDVVILATGGVPTSTWTPPASAARDTWDIISGAVKPAGEVLVYDDHGGHQSLDAIEALAATATGIEYVTRSAPLLRCRASPGAGYFAMLADNDVRVTLCTS